MLAFELVSRKRNPIKGYAISGVLLGLLIIVIIAIVSHRISDGIRIVFMGMAAFSLLVSLFILNYSVNFKNKIGRITFSMDSIAVELRRGREVIRTDEIRSIRFSLAGYRGQNRSTLFELFIWKPAIFSYQGGMNNFVLVITDDRVRKYEFHIPNRSHWVRLQQMVRFYDEMVVGRRADVYGRPGSRLSNK